MSSARRVFAPQLMLALAVVGLAVAFYDSYVIYNGRLLWCPPPIDGCNEVAASYYGVVYYLYMLGLAALLAFDPLSPALRRGAVLYAVLGVAFSLYFIVLQVGYIRAFCVYCLISAVTTVLLVVAAVVHSVSRSIP